MLTHPQIDPVVFQIGPLAVRWYGLMYLLGFAAAYMLIRHLARMRNLALDKDGVSDLVGNIRGRVAGHKHDFDVEFPELKPFAVRKEVIEFGAFTTNI